MSKPKEKEPDSRTTGKKEAPSFMLRAINRFIGLYSAKAVSMKKGVDEVSWIMR